MAWIGVIAALVIPWTDFQHHTHWSKVQWIPFVTPPIKAVDVIGNIVLYLPFGYLFPSTPPSGPSTRAAVLTAVVMSTFMEWTQLYSHFRFPSFTDVTCNSLGAWAGVWLARRRHSG